MDWQLAASIFALGAACFSFGFAVANSMQISRRQNELRRARREWLKDNGF